ncbi:hypothetical protein N0V83_002758 [Neocucurbitaria cava]|uniref:Serine hydrolase domain-containing protein n=1 Tax=Neocucurbitaria cava TaxID=798079 RepID=A0A9W8YCR0_9PLEO|nr:hypothetical protein N0V83_002758 [Neocucurbitaria cava]
MPRTLSHLIANTQLLSPTNLRIRSHWRRTMAAAPPPSRRIKLLMLHGYTQSGSLFQAKTGALRKTLSKAFPKGIELVYPTAPIRLTPADESWLAGTATDTTGGEQKQEQELDAWAWWKRKDQGGGNGPGGKGYTYEGIEIGLGHIASVLKEQGPFDGVVGFSQGGACAAMVASLLEPDRRAAFQAQVPKGGLPYPQSFESDDASGSSRAIHPPLKFAVSYSGFLAIGENPYQAFYDPKIQTPMLHFLGTQDVVVEEKRSLALVQACVHQEERYVVYHPGGHFLPSTQKASVNALIGFIKEVLHSEEEAAGAGKKEEESVEDMDVPFLSRGYYGLV